MSWLPGLHPGPKWGALIAAKPLARFLNKGWEGAKNGRENGKRKEKKKRKRHTKK